MFVDLCKAAVATALCCAATAALGANSSVGLIATPPDGGVVSGVSVVAGYHCTSQNIDVYLDGARLSKAGAGTTINTAAVCGRTDTGFSYLYNFSNLSNGAHTISVYADNVLFDTHTVYSVRSGDTAWLSGASKSMVVPNFPTPGQSATLVWVQAFQNFMVQGVTGTAVTDALLGQTVLLKGVWTMAYAIGSASFFDTYGLTTISGSRNNEGGYYINGQDEYNQLVSASYWPSDGKWTLLDTGTIIDLYFVFKTDGMKTLPGGCYYQITKSTGAWSACYEMYATKWYPTFTATALDTDDPKLIQGARRASAVQAKIARERMLVEQMMDAAQSPDTETLLRYEAQRVYSDSSASDQVQIR